MGGIRREVEYLPTEDAEEYARVEVDFEYHYHRGYGARLFSAIPEAGEAPHAELVDYRRVDGKEMDAALDAAALSLWNAVLGYKIVEDMMWENE
jgi:hypothetical protein